MLDLPTAQPNTKKTYAPVPAPRKLRTIDDEKVLQTRHSAFNEIKAIPRIGHSKSASLDQDNFRSENTFLQKQSLSEDISTSESALQDAEHKNGPNNFKSTNTFLQKQNPSEEILASEDAEHKNGPNKDVTGLSTKLNQDRNKEITNNSDSISYNNNRGGNILASTENLNLQTSRENLVKPKPAQNYFMLLQKNITEELKKIDNQKAQLKPVLRNWRSEENVYNFTTNKGSGFSKLDRLRKQQSFDDTASGPNLQIVESSNEVLVKRNASEVEKERENVEAFNQSGAGVNKINQDASKEGVIGDGLRTSSLKADEGIEDNGFKKEIEEDAKKIYQDASKEGEKDGLRTSSLKADEGVKRDGIEDNRFKKETGKGVMKITQDASREGVIDEKDGLRTPSLNADEGAKREGTEEEIMDVFSRFKKETGNKIRRRNHVLRKDGFITTQTSEILEGKNGDEIKNASILNKEVVSKTDEKGSGNAEAFSEFTNQTGIEAINSFNGMKRGGESKNKVDINNGLTSTKMSSHELISNAKNKYSHEEPQLNDPHDEFMSKSDNFQEEDFPVHQSALIKNPSSFNYSEDEEKNASTFPKTNEEYRNNSSIVGVEELNKNPSSHEEKILKLKDKEPPKYSIDNHPNAPIKVQNVSLKAKEGREPSLSRVDRVLESGGEENKLDAKTSLLNPENQTGNSSFVIDDRNNGIKKDAQAKIALVADDSNNGIRKDAQTKSYLVIDNSNNGIKKEAQSKTALVTDERNNGVMKDAQPKTALVTDGIMKDAQPKTSLVVDNSKNEIKKEAQLKTALVTDNRNNGIMKDAQPNTALVTNGIIKDAQPKLPTNEDIPTMLKDETIESSEEVVLRKKNDAPPRYSTETHPNKLVRENSIVLPKEWGNQTHENEKIPTTQMTQDEEAALNLKDQSMKRQREIKYKRMSSFISDSEDYGETWSPELPNQVEDKPANDDLMNQRKIEDILKMKDDLANQNERINVSKNLDDSQTKNSYMQAIENIDIDLFNPKYRKNPMPLFPKTNDLSRNQGFGNLNKEEEAKYKAEKDVMNKEYSEIKLSKEEGNQSKIKNALLTVPNETFDVNTQRKEEIRNPSPTAFDTFTRKRGFGIGKALLETSDDQNQNPNAFDTFTRKRGFGIGKALLDLNNSETEFSSSCYDDDEMSDVNVDMFAISDAPMKIKSASAMDELMGIHNFKPEDILLKKRHSAAGLRDAGNIPGFNRIRKWNNSEDLDGDDGTGSKWVIGDSDSEPVIPKLPEQQLLAGQQFTTNSPPESIASSLATTLSSNIETDINLSKENSEIVENDPPAPENTFLPIQNNEPETTEAETEWQYRLPSPPTAFRDSSPALAENLTNYESTEQYKTDSVVTSPELFEKLKQVKETQSEVSEDEKLVFNNKLSLENLEKRKSLVYNRELATSLKYKDEDTSTQKTESVSSKRSSVLSELEEVISNSKTNTLSAKPADNFIHSDSNLPNFKITTYDMPKKKINIFEDDSIRSNENSCKSISNLLRSQSGCYVGRSMENLSANFKKPDYASGNKINKYKAKTLARSNTEAVGRSESFSAGNWMPSNPVKRSKSQVAINQYKEDMSETNGDGGLSKANSLFDVSGLQSLEVMRKIQTKLKTPSTSTDELDRVEPPPPPKPTPREPPPEIPKPQQNDRYGPPSINLGTWSERPKSQITLKEDTDYKFNVSNTKFITSTNNNKQQIVNLRVNGVQQNPVRLNGIEMNQQSVRVSHSRLNENGTSIRLNESSMNGFRENSIETRLNDNSEATRLNDSFKTNDSMGFRKFNGNETSVRLSGSESVRLNENNSMRSNGSINQQPAGNVIIKIGGSEAKKNDFSSRFINHTTAVGFRKPLANVNAFEKQRPHSVAFDTSFDISRVPRVHSVELKKPFKDMNKSITQIRNEPESKSLNYSVNNNKGNQLLRINSFSQNNDSQSELTTNKNVPFAQVKLRRTDSNKNSQVVNNNNNNNIFGNVVLRNTANRFSCGDAPPPPPVLPKIAPPSVKTSRSNQQQQNQQVDSRDELLSAIRNFGGKKGLKSIKV